MDNIIDSLRKTSLDNNENVVSIAGKGYKLNTSDDAEAVVQAIKIRESLTTLNLEGNTIGVEAASAIAKALEKQPNFRYALWKDIFTGRLKAEIPKALKELGHGLMVGKAKLVVLDLSDNASGPIGVEGIDQLLRSDCCLTLQVLRLNNMGLGITGAKMLADALMKSVCLNQKPLRLKVFVAGRNRLENDGITALSKVFKKMGSLEELSVPQNSIYSDGITVLADALLNNPSLTKLNLNDNTLCENGAKSLANGLRNASNLTHLDIGDCLIKTEGAFDIAELLAQAHYIEEINVSYNAIRIEGGLAILEAIASKECITSINLDGNKFGEDGKNQITKRAKELKKSVDYLMPMDEDEGSEEDSEDDKDDECNDNDDDDDVDDVDEEDVEDDYDDESESLYDEEGKDVEEEGEGEEEEEEEDDDDLSSQEMLGEQTVVEGISAIQFINNPTMENLVALGPTAADKIVEEITRFGGSISSQIVTLIEIIVTTSSLLKADEMENMQRFELSEKYKVAARCTDQLYFELFSLALKSNRLSDIHNTLPVFLGLIKGEVKTPKRVDKKCCVHLMERVMEKSYFPKETFQLLQFMTKK